MGTIKKIFSFVMLIILIAILIEGFPKLQEQKSTILKSAFFVLIISFLYAKIEIEIEGEHGWASNLPTWKFKSDLIERWTNGKILTGYHIWMIIFFITLFHSPFLLISWTLYKEMILIGLFILFLTLEDFFWFITNPAFGIKNFNQKNKRIWWHKKWTGPLPDFYIESLLLSLILLVLGFSRLN